MNFFNLFLGITMHGWYVFLVAFWVYLFIMSSDEELEHQMYGPYELGRVNLGNAVFNLYLFGLWIVGVFLYWFLESEKNMYMFLILSVGHFKVLLTPPVVYDDEENISS